MKRILSFILIWAWLLCGCSFQADAHTPYLSQGERDKIEQGIFEDLHFVESSSGYISASFRNNSSYDIYDLYLINAATDTTASYFPVVPAKTTIRSNTSWENHFQDNADNQVYLNYTIDEYTYVSEATSSIDISAADSDTGFSAEERGFSIQVRTKTGNASLTNHETKEFSSGSSFPGLKNTKVYSIQPEISAYTDDVSVQVTFTGSKPANFFKTVVAKVYDADGILVSSSSLWFDDSGTASSYFFDLSYAEHTLVLEEQE